MLCSICSTTLMGIWDPFKTPRVCQVKDFLDDHSIRGFELPEDRPDHLHPKHHVFGHHPSQDSFEKSVQDGCFLCCLLDSKGQAYGDGKIRNLDKLGYYSVLAINFKLAKAPVFALFSSQCYIQQLVQQLEGSVADFNLRISPSTQDGATWGLIQGWLDTCLQSHTRCNKPKDPAFTPDHLLELDIDTRTFRLVAAAEIQAGTRYCTLTYAYQVDDAEITPSTIQQLQPLSILPQTYQDAFIVVEMLGLKHLWIDHLCLIQNSQLSLEQLTIKNRDIFLNSFCGIGATGATSPSSGLFAQREPQNVVPGLVDFPLDTSGNKSVLKFDYRTPQVESFSDEPMIEKPHAMQERLLTPRMIHFASTQVYWECYGALNSELNPHGIVLRPNTTLGREGEKTAGGRTLLSMWKPLLEAWFWSYEDPRDELLGRWSHFLAYYLKGRDEFPKYRLIRLDSVVAEMKHALKELGRDDAYLAGMWKDTLPVSLLWIAIQTGTKPTEYLAPSWSWASNNGVIGFPSHSAEEFDNGILCDFISGTCQVNDIGQPISGHIILMGKLLVAKVSHDTEWPLKGATRREILSVADPNTGTCLAEAPESVHKHRWNIFFDTEEDRRESVFFLPIKRANQEKGQPGSEDMFLIKGIALYKVDSGLFRRCGQADIMVRKDENKFSGLLDSTVQII
ncbi:unnamed protein product [Clonostachys solani]|uniref:Heterokaryon incompatibility domain-containing protein n=1 Tax=Clonostachys solani TaxID=160281 RepID=A0A9P0END3_9HYPO|nr:unnamed protein product [Clonostachys solani]